MKIIADNFLDYLATHGPDVAHQWEMLLKVANGSTTTSGATLKEMVGAFIEQSCYNKQRSPCHDFAEFFAGRGNMSKALLAKNCTGFAFDKAYREAHDILSVGGLQLYLTALLRLREGALAWFGTECSSFVVLCLSVKKRSPANDFLGDQDRPCVKRGNALDTVSALLFFLSWVTQLQPVLEQPANSCLPDLPAWKFLLHWTHGVCSKTYLGAFEGRSQKPLQLWHCCPNFSAIERACPQMVGASQLVTRDANGAFTGISTQLAESGHYPVAFGKAFAEIFCSNR